MSENQAPQPQQAAPADTVQLVGVKADGSEHNLGTIRMPAKMKAREIVRDMIGPIDEEAGNEAAFALWCCELLLEYVAATPPQQAPAGEWVATVDVVDGEPVDYETVPGSKLPDGSHRLHLGTAPAPQPVGLTDEQKHDLATNWFAEDWLIDKAIGMLGDYESINGIPAPQATQEKTR